MVQSVVRFLEQPTLPIIMLTQAAMWIPPHMITGWTAAQVGFLPRRAIMDQ